MITAHYYWKILIKLFSFLKTTAQPPSRRLEKNAKKKLIPPPTEKAKISLAGQHILFITFVSGWTRLVSRIITWKEDLRPPWVNYETPAWLQKWLRLFQFIKSCENYRHRYHHSWGIFNSQSLSLFVEIFVSLPNDLFFFNCNLNLLCIFNVRRMSDCSDLVFCRHSRV